MAEILRIDPIGKKQSTASAYYEGRAGYRANSRRQLTRMAVNAGLKLRKLEYLDQSPYAFRFSPVLYWIVYRYHEFVRSVRCLNFLNGWILCVLTKPDRRMKACIRYNG